MKPVNLRKTKRIFLDTETTGLDEKEHEIIEITLLIETVDFEHPNRPTPVVEWTKRIKPKHIEKAAPEALAINGYTEEEWSSAVPFEDIAPELKLLLMNAILVGHNLSFDIRFLQEEFRRAGIEIDLGHHFIDTVTLAYSRWAIPGKVEKLSLDTLRKYLRIPVAQTHSSPKDAYDCRIVFYRTIHQPPIEAFLRWLANRFNWVFRLFPYLG